MSTDPGQERTLGQLVASATHDISTLLRGEIALAKLELSSQVKKAGMGGILLAAAGVVAFYSVYFIFITIVEGIEALGLARWLSFLIVTVFMLLLAALLAYVGIRKMKTVKPVPEKTISNAQATIAGLKAATESHAAPVVSVNGSSHGTVPLGARPLGSRPAISSTAASAATQRIDPTAPVPDSSRDA